MTRKTGIHSLFDGDTERNADEPVEKKQRLPVLKTSSAAQRVVRRSAISNIVSSNHQFKHQLEHLCAIQLAQGGCTWLDDCCSVGDVQTLRATLASKLAFRSEMVSEVIQDISRRIADVDLLRAACLPMSSTEVCATAV